MPGRSAFAEERADVEVDLPFDSCAVDDLKQIERFSAFVNQGAPFELPPSHSADGVLFSNADHLISRLGRAAVAAVSNGLREPVERVVMLSLNGRVFRARRQQ